MLCGTVTKLLLLDSVTNAPPDGAAVFSVTVPVDEFPLVTVLGFSVSADTANTGGPHWFGTPPPPQVCPARLVQPHLRTTASVRLRSTRRASGAGVGNTARGHRERLRERRLSLGARARTDHTVVG